jgi:hypothetical protein
MEESLWRKMFRLKRKLIEHYRRLFWQAGDFLRRQAIPSGEAIPDILQILTAIPGKWLGPRFLSFGKEN